MQGAVKRFGVLQCFYLKDYFQKQNTAVKFYFIIVDRLDLHSKPKKKFVTSIGLTAEMINSKEDFINNILNPIGATATNVGVQTITVVNIQKFF